MRMLMATAQRLVRRFALSHQQQRLSTLTSRPLPLLPLYPEHSPCRSHNIGTTFISSWDHRQLRWLSRKGARMGHHMETLDEMAHRESHREALERRKKKKKHKHHDQDDDEQENVSEKAAPLSEQQQQQQVEPELAAFDESEANFEVESSHQEELPSLPSPDQVKERMLKVVDALHQSFQSIRGAEPTPELFDTITVDAYGERMPLGSVAQVVIVSPTLVTVTCFDPALAKDVRDAVRDSLELNPQLEEDGLVRVPMPRPSAETRRQTVKQLGKLAEAGRQRIRRIRRGAMDVVKKGQNGKLEGISKDDAFRVHKEIDELTEEVTKELNEEVEKKQQSVMAV